MTKTNRACHTRDAKVVDNAFMGILSKEETLREEAWDDKMIQLMTHIEMLIKHVIGTPIQKVNDVASNNQGYTN